MFAVAVGFEANICNLISSLRLGSQSVVLVCVLKIACERWVWKFICSRLKVKKKNSSGKINPCSPVLNLCKSVL